MRSRTGRRDEDLSPVGGRSERPFEISEAPSDSPRSMALVLATLFIAGATIGAVSLILPHPREFNDSALWGNVAIAYVAGVLLVLCRRYMSPWSLQIVVAVGTVVVTRAVYLSTEPSGFYAFYYVWVGAYAFFFFGRLWGTIHMALVGLAYAWVLTEVDATAPVARWVMTIGTLAVAGLLIDALAQRVRQRAVESAARARALAAVDSVAHELARRTSPEAAAAAICDAAVEVADAGEASLWQPTRDGGGLSATAATNPELRGTVLHFVGRPSGVTRAFTTGEQFFTAPDEESVGEGDGKSEGACALFQPVVRDGVTVAVLAVRWERPVSLDEEVAQVVRSLAAEASIAIERAELLERLERAARTDDLTGLLNRRGWDEYLARDLARAKRVGTSLCVAMLDLDHFKDYNDRFGHQAGDRLLKEATAAWEGVLRETDLLARYGGEEFAVALPDCPLEEAETLLERVRNATPEGETSSAGVVLWNGEEGANELVARADDALYVAKRAGRDRVIAR